MTTIVFRFVVVLLSWACVSNIGWAQTDSSKVILNNQFVFNDGVYIAEQWSTNTPSFAWEQIDAKLFINERNAAAHIEYLKEKGKKQYLSPTCIAKNGKLYVDIPNDGKSAIFYGFKQYGALCYYEKDTTYVKDIEMSAYNPLTGRPFRTKVIQREVTEAQSYFYDVKENSFHKLTLANLLAAIASDEKLTRSILSLSPDEANTKLYKTLLIYNDRNPIYMQ